MNIEEKYPLLIGHSDQGSQELHSIQEDRKSTRLNSSHT